MRRRSVHLVRRFLPPWARQLLALLLVAAFYLCSGAAWKVWMVTRYPPSDSTIDDAIYSALRPYNGLPVGYVLGVSFARLATALRLYSHASASDRPPAEEAVSLDLSIVNGGGAWAPEALYNLAAVEQQPDLLDKPGHEKSQTLFLYLDNQRWGRASIPQSSFLGEAAANYRRLAEQYPRSPCATDALNRLAALEDGEWDFQDARVCRWAAQLLDPARTQEDSSSTRRSPDNKDATKDATTDHALAAAYCQYLRAAKSQRPELAAALRLQAIRAGDTLLAAALSPGSPPRAREADQTGSGGQSLQLKWGGRPLPDVPVALLQMQSMAGLMAGGMMSGLSSDGPQGDLRSMASSLNPARMDDPLRTAALALESLEMSGWLARTLPLARTQPDGTALFPSAGPGQSGAAILLPPQAGDDLGLNPSAAANGDAFAFVPRVQILPPLQSLSSPPILRWAPYPGAASYQVSVAREPPSYAGSRSTALSPEWDSHLTWWQDQVHGTSVQMTPAGFVGPSTDLDHNGLWEGSIYRVTIVAEDASGSPIASSIGLEDHPDEFFHTGANWLALNTEESQAPSSTGPDQFLNFARIFGGRRRRRHRAVESDSDPLEQVLEMAHTLAPPAPPGTGAREPDLSPTPAHSPSAVQLVSWPSVATDGQGAIPLQNPVLQSIVEQSLLDSMGWSGR